MCQLQIICSIEHDRKTVMNGGRQEFGIKPLVSCLKLLTRKSSEETEENHGKPVRDPNRGFTFPLRPKLLGFLLQK